MYVKNAGKWVFWVNRWIGQNRRELCAGSEESAVLAGGLLTAALTSCSRILSENQGHGGITESKPSY